MNKMAPKLSSVIMSNTSLPIAVRWKTIILLLLKFEKTSTIRQGFIVPVPKGAFLCKHKKLPIRAYARRRLQQEMNTT